MKILPQIFLCFSLILLFNCNNVDNKKTLLVASQNFNDFNSVNRKFEIYSDSTFQFTESIKDIDHESDEKWTGKVEILKDTIKFNPFKLKYNRSETAVLKNGFIEFIDGEEPDRMKINKNSLASIKNIDFSKFKNTTVFTYYKKFNPLDNELLLNYDLTTKELQKVELLLIREFERNEKLKDYSEYLKQIVAIKNSQKEIIIRVHLFCKKQHLNESFEYYEISMMDGGNCNVYLELNLSTGKFNFINIAGIA